MNRLLTTITIAGLLLQTGAIGQPGSLDQSFGTGGTKVTPFGTGTGEQALAVAIQSDGKIVLAGYSNNGVFQEDFALARYNANGTLDNAFGSGGKVVTDFDSTMDRARAVVIQPDGKIIAAGYSGVSMEQKFALVRYNSNGALDGSFGNNGRVTTSNIGPGWGGAAGVALQPDGKIVAVGHSGTLTNSYYAIARYNSDGSLDNSFSGDGKLNTAVTNDLNNALDVVVQPDGRILVAGRSYSIDWDFSMARYEPNGDLDSTFGTDGTLTFSTAPGEDEAHAMVLQSDGKIVLAGRAEGAANRDFAVARFNANGTIDNSFGSGGKVITPMGTGNDDAYAVVVQPNGRIIVGGEARTVASDFGLVRYLPDGTPDPEFGNDGKVITEIGPSHDGVLGLALQSDGKLIAAGYSITTADDDFAVARYKTDWDVGINQVTTSNWVSISPNPVSQATYLAYSLAADEPVSIQLHDLNGRLLHVFVQDEPRQSGEHQELLLFPDLAPAPYCLTIFTRSKRATLKVMK